MAILNLLKHNSKLGLLLIGALYAVCYNRIYMDFVYRYFAYMVGECREVGADLYVLYIICSALPLLFYKGLVSIASMMSLMTYVLAYVPMLEAFYVTAGIETENRVGYSLLLLVVMIAFFSTDRVCIWKNAFLKQSKHRLWKVSVIEKLTVIILLYLVAIQIREMRFVNFITNAAILYQFRAENTLPGIANYLLGWEKTALLPILMVYYLRTNNTKKLVCVVGAFMLMFMIDYQKGTFFKPIIIAAFYYAVIRLKSLFHYLHAFIMGVFSIVSMTLIALIQTTESTLFPLAGIFILRSVCVATWLTSYYVRFFDNHPLTYYSHINVVNAITKSYPYDDQLGIVVAGGAMNANANFLLTDGYAAAKAVGIVLISVAFILMKSVVNSVGLKIDHTIALVMLLPVMMTFMNVSLFTTILSFGLGVFYILMLKVDFGNMK